MMLGFWRGLLGGVIAAVTMAGGLRAIGRGEKLPTEGLAQTAAKIGGKALRLTQALQGLKGGEKRHCPPRGKAHHFAACPACGRRWMDHGTA